MSFCFRAFTHIRNLGSVILIHILMVGGLQANTSMWTYNPPAAARVLYSGGWNATYNIGQVKASPEFDFPLQLVYFTGRDQEGLFGSQWFCPQLESSLIPLAKGYLLWTMPSGQQILLQQTAGIHSEFRSQDRLWRADYSTRSFDISNQDGWRFQYEKGRLTIIRSPTRRILEFAWRDKQLTGMRLTDADGSEPLLVLQLVYGENQRVSGLELHGQSHKFAYLKDGTNDRLNAWSPPVGDIARFLYHPETNVLWKVGMGTTDNPAVTETFTTKFVDPVTNDAKADKSQPKRQPVNHWLIEDQLGTYSYGSSSDGGRKAAENLNPGTVTVTYRSGVVEKSDYAVNRGVITHIRDGVAQKTYFYKSPGQRYDGKLRRIEENGKTLLEYRYDRKTGLLSETIDAEGQSTYYDYDPDFKRTKGDEWDPKPLRVRRGNLRKSEVIAEYRYHKDGRVAAVKDELGNLTQYSYSPRGELAAVTNPAGDKVEYTYDKLGRQTSVSTGGLTEKMAYDKNGRLAMRLAADGTKTEIIYNEQGHQSQLKRNGKVVKEQVRDDLQRVIGEKDSLMRLSRVERDLRGNLTAQIAPNGATTRYEYDDFNRRIAQIDGNGNRINFKYDSAGRLTSQTNALGNFQTWKYDSKTGKLLQRENGEQVVLQTYDKDGQLTSVDYGGGEKLTYTYDELGRPLSATKPDSSFEFSYNEKGQPIASRAVSGKNDHLLSYRYNPRGQRTGLMISKLSVDPVKPSQYETLQQTEQLYDSAGRLITILTNGIPAISYQYDIAGRPIRKTYGSSERGRLPLTVDISYDSAGHLSRMKFQDGRLTSPLELIYEWDDADQLTRRTWNGRNLRYEYDPSGQLLKVIDSSNQSVIEAYTYDSAGNMLTKLVDGHLTAMTYNAGNQLVKSYDLGPAGTQTVATLPKTDEGLEKLTKRYLSYDYDRAGRMVGTGSNHTQTYGWLDKLTNTTLPDGSTAKHTYWPDGQIAAISSSSSSSTKPGSSSSSETFLWDGLALLMRNDTVYIIESHASGGIPIASHPIGKPEEITYHLNDLLGTTLATVGPAGVKFSSLTSFGQPLKAHTHTALPNNTTTPTGPANPVPTGDSLPPTQP